MKRKYWITIVILALVATGYWILNSNPKKQKTSFTTSSIEKGDISLTIFASGTLNARNTVEVGTQVSGVIESVLVDFNDEVKKDQVIAKIDTRNLETLLQQAKARLMQAEVQYDQKKRAYEYSKKYNSEGGKDLSVIEAEAALEQVRSQMSLAEKNYIRYKELLENDVVSKIEYETKEADYLRLKANYEGVKASVNRAKANVSNVDLQKSLDDLKTSTANLSSAQADMNKAQVNLNFAIIKAPINGFVISRNIEVGQTVAATFQTPVLFTIANDLTKMEIEASIDEADIGMIKKNQEVIFSVDAYPDDFFEGTVEQIRLQPKVVSNVVTYTVIVSAKNDDFKLKPGMTATLDITAAQKNEVLKASVMAINFTPPNEYSEPWKEYLQNEGTIIRTSDSPMKIGVLWKVNGDQIIPKKVKTGLTDGTYIEIESNDFSPGDLVVTGLITESNKEKNSNSNPFMPSRPGQQKSKQ